MMNRTTYRFLAIVSAVVASLQEMLPISGMGWPLRAMTLHEPQ